MHFLNFWVVQASFGLQMRNVGITFYLYTLTVTAYFRKVLRKSRFTEHRKFDR